MQSSTCEPGSEILERQEEEQVIKAKIPHVWKGLSLWKKKGYLVELLQVGGFYIEQALKFTNAHYIYRVATCHIFTFTARNLSVKRDPILHYIPKILLGIKLKSYIEQITLNINVHSIRIRPFKICPKINLYRLDPK